MLVRRILPKHESKPFFYVPGSFHTVDIYSHCIRLRKMACTPSFIMKHFYNPFCSCEKFRGFQFCACVQNSMFVLQYNTIFIFARNSIADWGRKVVKSNSHLYQYLGRMRFDSELVGNENIVAYRFCSVYDNLSSHFFRYDPFSKMINFYLDFESTRQAMERWDNQEAIYY